MGVLVVTSDRFALHDTGRWHPERAARLTATAAALGDPEFEGALRVVEPREATDAELRSVHTAEHIGRIRVVCSSGGGALDADTPVVAASLPAALAGAGSGLRAIEEVEADRDAAPPGGDGDLDAAFCVVRPPGHHATASTAMGFCLFNNAAIAAMHARAKHGAERVAVIDFDVHHGNGTQDIFWDQKDLFYGSTHQMPLFPGTGATDETGVGNIFNAPLHPGDDGVAFRDAMDVRILPALEKHRPDLIIISAGFDAHERDPLANINLTEDDFAWVTRRLMDIADKQCDGRVVSVLEGGYDLMGLSLGVAAHVRALMGS